MSDSQTIKKHSIPRPCSAKLHHVPIVFTPEHYGQIIRTTMASVKHQPNTIPDPIIKTSSATSKSDNTNHLIMMLRKEQSIFAFVEEQVQQPVQAATEKVEQHNPIRRCISDSAELVSITSPPETEQTSFYLLEKEVTMTLKGPPPPSSFRKSRSCTNVLQVDAMINCQDEIGEDKIESRSYHSDTEILRCAENTATSSSSTSCVYSMDIIESGDDMCRRRKWDEIREKRSPLRSSSHAHDDSELDPYAPLNVPSNVQLVIKKWGPAVAISPERFFTKLLLSRGYAADNFPLVVGSLKVPPSRQQITDYNSELVGAVRSSDLPKLRKLHEAGSTMSACNRFSESIVHIASRRSDYEVVEYIVNNGGDCCIVDDYGRTPLHDACWRAEPRFDIVTLLLDQNLDLLRGMDVRGATPLKYVSEDNWLQWCAYLFHQKDKYWTPIGDPQYNLEQVRKHCDDRR